MTRPATGLGPSGRSRVTVSKSLTSHLSSLNAANWRTSHAGSLQDFASPSSATGSPLTCTSWTSGATWSVVRVYEPVDSSLPEPCAYEYQNSPCAFFCVRTADQPPSGSETSFAPDF